MLLTIKGLEKLKVHKTIMIVGWLYGNEKLNSCYAYFAKSMHVSI